MSYITCGKIIIVYLNYKLSNKSDRVTALYSVTLL